MARKKIRLVFWGAEKYNSPYVPYSFLSPKVSEVVYASETLEAPDGLDLIDICKMASYLNDDDGPANIKTEAKNIKKLTGLLKSFAFLRSGDSEEINKVNDEDYGDFKSRIKYDEVVKPIDGVLDLITLVDNTGNIKNTKLAKRQFDWKRENVSFGEFENICSRFVQKQVQKNLAGDDQLSLFDNEENEEYEK